MNSIVLSLFFMTMLINAADQTKHVIMVHKPPLFVAHYTKSMVEQALRTCCIFPTNLSDLVIDYMAKYYKWCRGITIKNAFSSDTRMIPLENNIFATFHHNIVDIWNTNGNRLYSCAGDPDCSIHNVINASHGFVILEILQDHKVNSYKVPNCYDIHCKLWNIRTGAISRALTRNDAPSFYSSCDKNTLLSHVLPDNRFVTYNTKCLKQYQIRDRSIIEKKSLKYCRLLPPYRILTALLFISPDTIAFGYKNCRTSNNNIALYDVNNNELLECHLGTKTIQTMTVFNRTLLAIAQGSDHDQYTPASNINIWCPKKKMFIKAVGTHYGDVNSLISPYNDILVSTSYDGTMKVWNVLTEACVQTLNPDYAMTRIIESAPLPSGHIVSLNRNGTITIFKSVSIEDLLLDTQVPQSRQACADLNLNTCSIL